MYEVQHRSREEHELYSFTLERRNLQHSYQANLVHIETQVAAKQQEQSLHLSALQGKLFQARALNPARFYGLLSGAGALYGWQKFAVLAHATSPTFLTLLIGALTWNFLSSFNASNFVSAMQVKGDSVELTVNDNLFKSKVVTARTIHIHQVGFYTGNGSQAQSEDQVLLIESHVDAEGNQVNEPLILSLSCDSIGDKNVMNWVLSEQTQDSLTDGDFADLLEQ